MILTPSSLLAAAVLTSTMFIGAFIISVIGGVFVAAGRRSRLAVVRVSATLWVNVVRGVPPLVWLFIIFFGISISGNRLTAMAAGIVAFGIIGTAYLGETFRAGIESLPAGQFDAVKGLGLPSWAAMRLIILPQALPIIIAGTASYAINLLKETALASLIGVQEITYLSNLTVNRGGNGLIAFTVAGAIYLLLSLILGMGGRFLGAKIERKFSVRTA